MEYLKPEHKRWILWILRVFFGIYLCSLVYLMFLSERYGRTSGMETYRYNLIPFQEIRRYFTYSARLSFESFFINIYGNVMAFMPFGFLLPMVSKKDRRFLPVLLISFCLTLTLETMQLLLRVGCFDVDDMILNVAGAVIGYWLYRLTDRILRKYLLRFGKGVPDHRKTGGHSGGEQNAADKKRRK